MGLKILVCGSRDYTNYGRILGCLKGLEVSLVIAGGCRGADTLAVRAAKELGIPFVEYRAEWVRYGKSAGPIRNSEMLEKGKPDFVLVFHPDLEGSKGSRDMVSRVKRLGISFRVVG